MNLSLTTLNEYIPANQNKLVLVGNGFDLAHGIQSSYKDFLDWLVCAAFKEFVDHRSHESILFEIKNQFTAQTTRYPTLPTTMEEALQLLRINNYQSFNPKSTFFARIIDKYISGNWVDVERFFFRMLKSSFKNPSENSVSVVGSMNLELDYFIDRLTDYIAHLNSHMGRIERLNLDNHRLRSLFTPKTRMNPVVFLNFNYTDTLIAKNYATPEETIYIHGQVSDIANNPLIFGYGDETDPIYQDIEDSGENVYLEHIKSFGYFKTNKYQTLISYIDSAPYSVSILGHSCGLSDRVLLSEIFEHRNCTDIDVFYHIKKDGTDNFKEITQEISRHFKQNNKSLMRRRVRPKDSRNVIPQSNNSE